MKAMHWVSDVHDDDGAGGWCVRRARWCKRGLGMARLDKHVELLVGYRDETPLSSAKNSLVRSRPSGWCSSCRGTLPRPDHAFHAASIGVEREQQHATVIHLQVSDAAVCLVICSSMPDADEAHDILRVWLTLGKPAWRLSDRYQPALTLMISVAIALGEGRC